MCEDAAAKALTQLYNDPELRKKFGKVGREKVLRNYNWNSVNLQWDKLIRGMTG